jgi:hypothetical protein
MHVGSVSVSSRTRLGRFLNAKSSKSKSKAKSKKQFPSTHLVLEAPDGQQNSSLPSIGAAVVIVVVVKEREKKKETPRDKLLQ